MVVGLFKAVKRKISVLLGLIIGLPPALPAMPLELTVLYNSLLFVMGTSDCAIKGEAEGIRQGLCRGKENYFGALVMYHNWPEEKDL